MRPSALDEAWAAGVFEGEGSITTQNNQNSERLRVRFSMSMTDRDVMYRFLEIVGCGSIADKPSWHSGSTKPQWRWQASKPDDVEKLAVMFRPYLGERRLAALERCLKEYEEQPPRRHHFRDKTHCPQGHPYDAANTVRYGALKARQCLTCQRLRWRKRYKATQVALGQERLL